MLIPVAVAVAEGLGEAIEGREDWFLFSEISVPLWLDPRCGEAEDHGRRTERKENCHLTVARKQRGS